MEFFSQRAIRGVLRRAVPLATVPLPRDLPLAHRCGPIG